METDREEPQALYRDFQELSLKLWKDRLVAVWGEETR